MSVRLSVVMEIPGKEPRNFEYEFEGERITLGRDENNDIQIPLSTVSRNHAVIKREGGEWFIEDLKSTHGTKHNGKVLGAGGKKLLREGDTVEIVHFCITFSTQESFSEDYSVEHTEALARKMVEEVLASIGTEEMPYIRVMNGPDEGRKFELRPDIAEAVIGRGTDCDYQINDANISRRHAVIRRDWTDITIEDLGSKNGVIINDRKVNKAASLRDADEILLGAVRLTFIDPSAKFLGKLDDIPGFADETRGEDPAPGPDEDASAEFRDPEPAPPPPEPEPPAAMGAGLPGGEDDPLPPTGEDGLEPLGLDDEQEASDLVPVQKKGLGAFEYAMIGVAALVVVGLIVTGVIVTGVLD